MAELPLLVLPHPIGQVSNDEMRQIADRSFAEIEFILTAPREQIEPAYAGATASRSAYS